MNTIFYLFFLTAFIVAAFFTIRITFISYVLLLANSLNKKWLSEVDTKKDMFYIFGPVIYFLITFALWKIAHIQINF